MTRRKTVMTPVAAIGSFAPEPFGSGRTVVRRSRTLILHSGRSSCAQLELRSQKESLVREYEIAATHRAEAVLFTVRLAPSRRM